MRNPRPSRRQQAHGKQRVSKALFLPLPEKILALITIHDTW
jgi:hypothetical protein